MPTLTIRAGGPSAACAPSAPGVGHASGASVYALGLGLSSEAGLRLGLLPAPGASEPRRDGDAPGLGPAGSGRNASQAHSYHTRRAPVCRQSETRSSAPAGT
jgi:hypothetical protein